MHGDRLPHGSAAGDGRECMQRLAMSAIDALQRAGLDDCMNQVNGRIFGRTPTELVEWFETQDGPHCRYRPMVELVLLEVAAIGSDSTVDLDERRRRIDWTLQVAGF